MNCKPIYVGRDSIGDRFDDGEVFVFFGNRHFNEDEFARLFPNWRPFQLKQIHSSRTITVDETTSSKKIEGDSSISLTPHLALITYTADCLPILIYNSDSGKIASCHAGWRGLELNIIGATLDQLTHKTSKALRAWVGPHIFVDSFEVDLDIASRLGRAPRSSEEFIQTHPKNPEKKLVNLTSLAKSQLRAAGVLKENIWIHPKNTFTNTEYFSHRRGDRGRLLNFIVKV